MNPTTVEQLIRHVFNWRHEITYNRWLHEYGCASCRWIRVRP